MWIPKWYWEAQIRQRDELERRVNRLELILLQDAKNKIASLKDEEAGTNKKGMYDICILERNYINSRDSLVQMSVELPGHDWCELSNSPYWTEVENFLSRKKNKDSQKLHIAAEGLLENP